MRYEDTYRPRPGFGYVRTGSNKQEELPLLLDRLVFARGESTGTIDVPPRPHAEFAKIAIDTPLAAARATMNFNQACWKLFSKVYGSGRAA